jgi:hypothetical protein
VNPITLYSTFEVAFPVSASLAICTYGEIDNANTVSNLCPNHFFSAHIALAVVRRNRNLFLRRHLDPSAHCVLKSRKSLLAQSAQIMKREPTPARQTDIDKNET